jgi:hypothetical protein
VIPTKEKGRFARENSLGGKPASTRRICSHRFVGIAYHVSKFAQWKMGFTRALIHTVAEKTDSGKTILFPKRSKQQV